MSLTCNAIMLLRLLHRKEMLELHKHVRMHFEDMYEHMQATVYIQMQFEHLFVLCNVTIKILNEGVITIYLNENLIVMLCISDCSFVTNIFAD